MALYTGIDAYNKIKGIDYKVISKVPFYNEMRFILEYSESKGNYPKLDYILQCLGVEDDIEDTDKNYHKYHSKFIELLQEYEDTLNIINNYNLKDKFKRKEVWFVSRDPELAQTFKDEFQSEEFYFRKLVDADKIKEVLVDIRESYDTNKKFAYMNDIINRIDELKGEYFFEVHVS